MLVLTKDLRFSGPRYEWLLFFIFLATSLFSCRHDHDSSNPKFGQDLKYIDSLVIAGQQNKANLLLKKLRSSIPDHDPFIGIYYSYVSSHEYLGPDHGNAYADSALAFFKDQPIQDRFPKIYRQALLAKGDACFKSFKYITAITYYAQARKIRLRGECDNGDLANKIAGVYYEQGNYRTAARLFIEKFERVLECSEALTSEKKFIILQGAINNAAYSYERAGMLDSAAHYYLKDVRLIDSVERNRLASQRNLDAARAVVFDNLGGIMTQSGKLELAINYLSKSLALSNEETDPTKVTTYIKLTNAYVLSGKLPEAKSTLDQGSRLLSLYPEKDFRVRWLKVNAEYQYKAGNLGEAYLAQTRHMHLKDSLASAKSELYRLDVSREFNSLQEQARIAELAQKARYRKFYLIGSVLISGLSIVIIILIIRSLRRNQAGRKEAIRHNEQLQIALTELERVNQNYVRIMRVMAHDLRNPLGGISGLAQVLLDDEELNQDSRHMLSLIETTSIHSLEMINELLKSDLGDSGPLHKEDVDLHALVFESVELLQFKAKEKAQHITYHSEQGKIIIPLNYEKIWRVINNLIVNALKFSNQNEYIEVKLQKGKHHVVISVSDRGIGIPEQDRDIIFEMFTPAKRVGTNGEQPFGLGLSISKNIIERHHGKIWYENRDGGGTTFFISLPY